MTFNHFSSHWQFCLGLNRLKKFQLCLWAYQHTLEMLIVVNNLGDKKSIYGLWKNIPLTYVGVLSAALIQLAFLSRFGLLSCIGKL